MFREGNISCVVHNSYSERTIEDSYHFNVLWYQYRWGYGFAEFRNNSIATLACNDFRDYGFPPVNAPQIFTLPWSGSEYIRDNVTLFQNVRLHGDPSSAFRAGVAVTLYGTNITVFMDQGVPLPTPCSQANGVKPCIRSQGNTVSSLFVRLEDLYVTISSFFFSSLSMSFADSLRSSPFFPFQHSDLCIWYPY